MAANKTRQTATAPAIFLASIGGARGDDAQALCTIMAEVSGEPATMWGPSIIGFGLTRYTYDSGREGEICTIGFAPRAAALTLYGMGVERNAAILQRLGKHKTSKSCLYLKALDDVDPAVLRELIEAAWSVG